MQRGLTKVYATTLKNQEIKIKTVEQILRGLHNLKILASNSAFADYRYMKLQEQKKSWVHTLAVSLSVEKLWYKKLDERRRASRGIT
jgi:hypothetical protein